ncbi:hypothetical protein [Flavobacterium sp. C3NV]|uniref:hypothetical protein n=1 Tax=Flavobacterium sp. C3NV TaxID=3393358 RepID=UPI00398F9D33
MKNKIKYFIYTIILLGLFYEGYYFISFQANSHLVVRGGELNKYKSDFVLCLNGNNIDTLNVNIPTSYSKSVNLTFGKNKIKMRSLDDTKNYETNIYFYGLFTWNVLEVTSKNFIFNSYYSLPPME